MNVYVAMKWERRERAREVMAAIKAAGHHVTHDWTHEDESAMDPAERDAYLEQCAQEDLQGVAECDVLVIEPTTGCKGAWVEFGAAVIDEKPVIVIDPEKKMECIFERLPCVRHVPDLAACIDELEDVQRYVERWS